MIYATFFSLVFIFNYYFLIDFFPWPHPAQPQSQRRAGSSSLTRTPSSPGAVRRAPPPVGPSRTYPAPPQDPLSLSRLSVPIQQSRRALVGEWGADVRWRQGRGGRALCRGVHAGREETFVEKPWGWGVRHSLTSVQAVYTGSALPSAASSGRHSPHSGH